MSPLDKHIKIGELPEHDSYWNIRAYDRGYGLRGYDQYVLPYKIATTDLTKNTRIENLFVEYQDALNAYFIRKIEELEDKLNESE